MLYWIFLFISFFSLAQDFPLRNGFDQDYDSPKEISVSVLSTEKAKQLFQKLALDPKNNFSHVNDHCYIRAHKMAKLAEQDHIQMGKVFIEGTLQVLTDKSPSGKVKLGWHVAPVAYVISLTGKRELMVFDPTFFNEPTPVDQWKKKFKHDSRNLTTQIDNLYYGSRYQYFPRSTEGYKKKWHAEDEGPVTRSPKKTLRLEQGAK